MKSFLTIKLSAGFETVVEKGKTVKSAEVIARKKIKEVKEKIPVAKILSISPKRVGSYLTKRLREKVGKGEILAKKDGILKSTRILSPSAGFIDSIDLTDGTLLFISEKSFEIVEKSPIDGMVEGVGSGEITLSFAGKLIEADQGRGGLAIGLPLVFEKKVDIDDFYSEVAEKIIIAKAFTEGGRAKLKALRALGLISLEYYDDFPILVKLNQKKWEQLVLPYQGKLVVFGERKQVFIPVES